MRWAGIFLILSFSSILNVNSAIHYQEPGSVSSSTSSIHEFANNPTDEWVTAPQWISDLASLLSLPVNQPILMQVIKSGIGERETASNFTDALELLKVGLVLYPSDPFFPYRMGMIMAVFQPDQAQQYLALAEDEDKALATDANQVIGFVEATKISDALDWVHLGQVLGQVNEWKLAEKAFTTAIEKNSQLADGWALLGQARVMLGQDGFSQFSKALSVNPKSPVGLALMSLYWKEHQRYDLALDYMRLLSTIQPDQIAWTIELGNLYSLSQDLGSAFSKYQLATEMSPSDPQTWQNLALFCLNFSAQLEDAGLPAARKAMELAPNDPLSPTLMGQILIKQGDKETAERFLLQAVKIAPEYSAAHYFLGYLYSLSDDKVKAFAELSKVIEIDGNKNYGPLARRLLEQDFGNA